MEPVSVLRLLRYKIEPSSVGEGVLGCGAHSDYGFCTLLHVKSSRSGLEIRARDGSWVPVRCVLAVVCVSPSCTVLYSTVHTVQ